MTYTEKKRSMFLGLPWTFTSYTVTDENNKQRIITKRGK